MRPAWVIEAEVDPHLAFVAREWDKAAATPGAWFDESLAEKVVEIWPKFFRHTEGRFAGKPFNLVPWEAAILRLLVGWKNADGWRLYRRLILWIGRKNGKSEFIAALALFFWLFDGEMGGQAFAMARNEKQARIVFEKAKTMARLSPQIGGAVQVFKKSLYCPELWARFELLSGKAEGKHGLSASVIVGDEIHEWPDDELYTTLHQSVAARDQPIELLASTAGYKGRGYGWTVWEESRALADGRLGDPTTLSVIFAADPEDDWTAEETWRKANPNLGISPKIDYLRTECAKAQDNPRLEASFRRYHCNQWVENATRWIPTSKWDACTGETPWRDLRQRMLGRACYGALDLSSTRDVTALVWLFPPDERIETWVLIVRLFVPEDTVPERVKNDRIDYDKWVHAGAMETTPGNTVDQNAVQDAIRADGKLFDVKQIGYDPWQAAKLATELFAEGAPMIEVRQGYYTLGEATKAFERMVYAGELAHGGQPALRWMAGNAVIVMDRNANYLVSKAKSSEKIDGVSAAISALALALRAEAPATSYFEHLTDEDVGLAPADPAATSRGGDSTEIDRAILADPSHPRWQEMRELFEQRHMDEEEW